MTWAAPRRSAAVRIPSQFWFGPKMLMQLLVTRDGYTKYQLIACRQHGEHRASQARVTDRHNLQGRKR
jgi:hypothetical protein